MLVVGCESRVCGNDTLLMYNTVSQLPVPSCSMGASPWMVGVAVLAFVLRARVEGGTTSAVGCSPPCGFSLRHPPHDLHLPRDDAASAGADIALYSAGRRLVHARLPLTVFASVPWSFPGHTGTVKVLTTVYIYRECITAVYVLYR